MSVQLEVFEKATYRCLRCAYLVPGNYSVMAYYSDNHAVYFNSKATDNIPLLIKHIKALRKELHRHGL